MIGELIKERREQAGLTQSQLAEQLGVEQPTVQRWESGARKPNMAMVAKIAGVLAIDVDDALRSLAGYENPHRRRRELWTEHMGPRKVPPSVAPSQAQPPMLQRDLPVYGTALGADLEFVSLDGHPVAVEQTMLNQADQIDSIRRLPVLQEERDAYALYTQGSSMEPAFEDGEPVLVTPGRPLRPRDYVVVHLVRPDGDEGEEASAVLLKRLIRRSGSFVELEQFNPPAKFRVDADRVSKIHRVMRWAEASGL